MNKWVNRIAAFLFLMVFVLAGAYLAWIRYTSFQDSVFNSRVWNQDLFNEMVLGVFVAGFSSGIIFTLGCYTARGREGLTIRRKPDLPEISVPSLDNPEKGLKTHYCHAN